MRFAALTVITVVVLAGCGSSSAPPYGAYSADFSGSGSQCLVASHTASVGNVSGTAFSNTLTDGLPLSGDTSGQNGSVRCSVWGIDDKTFGVDGDIQLGVNSLHVSIPSIATSATATSPVTGGVTFSSLGTGGVSFVDNSCTFYFSGSHETVKAGAIWGQFSCPSMLASSISSVCKIPTGYFVLDNCYTSQ